MDSLQLPYHQLRERLLRCDGERVFADVLTPWLEQATAETAWLADLRRRAAPDMVMTKEENWRLYALSRIVDLLTLCCSGEDHAWAGGSRVPPITRDEFVAVMLRLGIEQHTETTFHPFFHEIAAVRSDPGAARPELESVRWPGFRLGALLISRAGCVVRASPDDLVAEIAADSTLYWAHVRGGRPTGDLSLGWGSNSQWRTPFRLDFAVDGALFYNVAAGTPRSGGDDEIDHDLVAEEKIELLRHRCFVRCSKRHDDRWPWDWTLVERPGEALQLTKPSIALR